MILIAFYVVRLQKLEHLMSQMLYWYFTSIEHNIYYNIHWKFVGASKLTFLDAKIWFGLFCILILHKSRLNSAFCLLFQASETKLSDLYKSKLQSGNHDISFSFFFFFFIIKHFPFFFFLFFSINWFCQWNVPEVKLASLSCPVLSTVQKQFVII